MAKYQLSIKRQAARALLKKAVYEDLELAVVAAREVMARDRNIMEVIVVRQVGRIRRKIGGVTGFKEE